MCPQVRASPTSWSAVLPPGYVKRASTSSVAPVGVSTIEYLTPPRAARWHPNPVYWGNPRLSDSSRSWRRFLRVEYMLGCLFAACRNTCDRRINLDSIKMTRPHFVQGDDLGE